MIKPRKMTCAGNFSSQLEVYQSAPPEETNVLVCWEKQKIKMLPK